MSVGDEGMKMTVVPAIEVLSKVQLETQAIANPTQIRNEEGKAAAENSQHNDTVSFSFGANVPNSDGEEEKKRP